MQPPLPISVEGAFVCRRGVVMAAPLGAGDTAPGESRRMVSDSYAGIGMVGERPHRKGYVHHAAPARGTVR